MSSIRLSLLCILLCHSLISLSAQDKPNILLIIADDLGVDALRGYHDRATMATTPTIDSLMREGITFENAFAAPVCSPTRASILTGKYGINNGIQSVPGGTLDPDLPSLFDALKNETNGLYTNALIGKWHLATGTDIDHPTELGIDYYTGLLGGGTQDYYNWQKTENGSTSRETEYITSVFTDKAIDWVGDQTQPWFLWWAHVAPHSPFHEPPTEMYTIANTQNDRRKYMAMIESMDYSINRLLSTMTKEERDNTLVIFIGDNGTPGQVLQDYPNGHSKGSLYQGGVRVPMIVSGAGVTRKGERASALVHVTDIFATVLEVAGVELPGGRDNSLSFDHLLSGKEGLTRPYNYTEINQNNLEKWAIRDDQYKLIDNDMGDQEFYDLQNDSFELVNLLATNLTADQQDRRVALETEARQRRTAWSCHDAIKNGDEVGIDCGGTYCNPCVPSSVAELQTEIALVCYPNPAQDFIDILSPHYPILSIRIYTIAGQLVHVIDEVKRRAYRVKLEEHRVEEKALLIEVMTAGGTRVEQVVIE